jgi:pimeloyl-ACP methyl ester carboxylesterase
MISMALTDLVLPIIITCVIIYLLVLVLKNTMLYFEGMDKTVVSATKLKIPVGDIELNARLIYPKYALDENSVPKKKLPLIFFNHGWGAGIDMPLTAQYVISLAIGGPYAVLMYDCRGLGKSPAGYDEKGLKLKKRTFTDKIFDDIPKVIEFGLNLPNIDTNHVGFIGMSMGGQIALSRAYPDTRITAVVAMCTPYNAKENFARRPENLRARFMLFDMRMGGVNPKNISDEINRSISPEFIIDRNNIALNQRVMLLHTKNDCCISYNEFLKNKEALGLPDENVLVTKGGDHIFLHQEALVISSALRFFKEKI